MEREFVIHVNTLHHYTSLHYKSCHKYRNRKIYAINTYWEGPFTIEEAMSWAPDRGCSFCRSDEAIYDYRRRKRIQEKLLEEKRIADEKSRTLLMSGWSPLENGWRDTPLLKFQLKPVNKWVFKPKKFFRI